MNTENLVVHVEVIRASSLRRQGNLPHGERGGALCGTGGGIPWGSTDGSGASGTAMRAFWASLCSLWLGNPAPEMRAALA